MMSDKYAATAWGDSAVAPYDLRLPSGQLCRVKKLEMVDIFQLGIVDRLDTFSGELLGTTKKKPQDKAKSKKQEAQSELQQMMKLLGDTEKFNSLEEVLDKVVLAAVLQPTILPKPVDEEDRKTGCAYIDKISFMDKMHIFSEVFSGLGDLEQFRPGQAAGVGDLAEVAGLGDTPE